ncbi:hypothetical protein HFP89_06315 [Wenzhouxiangella sp. XN79A]|uniref:InlB B-repeat-containing protein n=1 Tax=Wenzhouxiangella sp. XN79A TaxID=2724193 RepID=UPI00144AAB86|nr:hypothetical protein [Wenzhouxiangella sp. XN79A]NKI34776.1 hypothetical protein [Wenzhouxiangella sp. XN79A]
MTARTDGVCSLTEAIDNANRDARTWPDCPGGSGADRLELTPGHAYTAVLPWTGSQSAVPPIRDDLEIIGFGATLMRDSSEPFRLIEVSNASVRIVGMMLEGGLSDSPSGGAAMDGGGAILVQQADLIVEGSTLRANRAAGLFTLGGAIRMDDSEVTILDSLLEGNSATSTASNAGGGAIAQFNGSLTIRRSALIDNFTDIPCNPGSPSSFRSNGGALRIEASADTGAQAYIYDSTIAGNRAVSGGGIHVAAIADTGVAGIEDVFVQVIRSTVVANEIGCPDPAGQGDGIRVQTLGGGEGLVAFGNTILHGNGRSVGATVDGVDCSADVPNVSFVSLEGNVLDDDDTCPGGGFDAFAADIDPVIDTQRNFTHYLPLANGPAVDFFETGVNCPNGTEDQLGNLRAGGAGQGGSLCDVGAIELPESGPGVALSVSLAGAGSGTVQSLPAGIDCPGVCSTDFPNGTEVQLIQMPDPGSGFDGWGGSCSGDGACVVTMDQPRSVVADFAALNTLNVNVSVGGSVTSTPAGIDCPDTSCTADFLPAEKVILQAEPEPGATFAGWSGDCSGTGPCVVSMEQERFVVATFSAVPGDPTLDVSIQGSGSITSLPSGIDCPGTCSAEFPSGTEVTLTATPSAGFAFDSWSGDCSGDGPCTISMDGPRAVTADFIAVNPLDVTVSGPGSVTSTPPGIDCPATSCSAAFLPAEKVVLQAQPDPGATFVGWAGDCSGTGPCVVSMESPRQVTATFTAPPSLFTLDVAITGSGSVTSVNPPIDCPGICSTDYVSGTVVELVATPAPGWVFDRWEGDCSGSGACVVTMNGNRSVTAVFEATGFELRVVLEGEGVGQVVELPGSGLIDCPGVCSAVYPVGTEISLGASIEPGTRFIGYRGDCQGGTCTVTMDQDREVRAVFLSAEQIFIDSFE